MTTTPAIEWLDVGFSDAINRHGRDVWAAPSSTRWHGPSYIRPMIQLRSVMDGSKAMHIQSDDYDDPERWWL